MTRTRFTIYAVSRDTASYTSDDGIAYAHVHDEAAALSRKDVIATEGFALPTRVVERMREYPFDVVAVLWRCDETSKENRWAS